MLSKSVKPTSHPTASHQPPVTSHSRGTTLAPTPTLSPQASLGALSLSTLLSSIAAPMSDGCNTRPALAGGDPDDWPYRDNHQHPTTCELYGGSCMVRLPRE